MKLITPKLLLDDNEGFTPEKDIFQRRNYAEILTSLIENVDDDLVIALDAPWGEGKTTFVKMWIGMLNEGAHKDRIKTIYFDAYKNDFLEDPMLALAGEVNNLLEQLPNDKVDANKRTQYRTSALNALKVITRAGVRISLRALTAGLVDDTVLEDAKVEGETVDLYEKYLSKRLSSIEEDRQVLNRFQQTIEGIVNDLGDNARLIFFIDELDRCKPSFALDLLETIKHIFSVPGVVFVLVTHKEQMQEIIRTRYGAKIDSLRYLQKFIHLWAELPKNKLEHNNDGMSYLLYCMRKMEYPYDRDPNNYAHEIFKQLINHYNMSFRDIERSLTNFAILMNLTTTNYIYDYLFIGAYLSIIKLMYPAAFNKIRNNEITYSELIESTNLEGLQSSHLKDTPENHLLKWLLRFHMSDEEGAAKLIEESGNKNYTDRYGSRDRGAVKHMTQLLVSFTG